MQEIEEENKRYKIDDIPNYSHSQFLDIINSIVKGHFNNIGKKMESATSNFIYKFLKNICKTLS